MIDFINALTKAIKSEHTEESKRRASICANCTLKEKRFYSDFVNSEIKDIKGYVCTLCDCPLATKIFATEQKNICTEWSK